MSPNALVNSPIKASQIYDSDEQHDDVTEMEQTQEDMFIEQHHVVVKSKEVRNPQQHRKATQQKLYTSQQSVKGQQTQSKHSKGHEGKLQQKTYTCDVIKKTIHTLCCWNAQPAGESLLIVVRVYVPLGIVLLSRRYQKTTQQR